MPNDEVEKISKKWMQRIHDDMEIDQLNIRRIQKTAKVLIKESAQARGLTIADYVGRLALLHRLALAAGAHELLEVAGLGEVKV